MTPQRPAPGSVHPIALFRTTTQWIRCAAIMRATAPSGAWTSHATIPCALRLRRSSGRLSGCRTSVPPRSVLRIIRQEAAPAIGGSHDPRAGNYRAGCRSAADRRMSVKGTSIVTIASLTRHQSQTASMTRWRYSRYALNAKAPSASAAPADRAASLTRNAVARIAAYPSRPRTATGPGDGGVRGLLHGLATACRARERGVGVARVGEVHRDEEAGRRERADTEAQRPVAQGASKASIAGRSASASRDEIGTRVSRPPVGPTWKRRRAVDAGRGRGGLGLLERRGHRLAPVEHPVDVEALDGRASKAQRLVGQPTRVLVALIAIEGRRRARACPAGRRRAREEPVSDSGPKNAIPRNSIRSFPSRTYSSTSTGSASCVQAEQ